MGFHFRAAGRRTQQPSAAGIEIIPMKRRHLKAVVAIEQQAFPSPWSLSLYLSELALASTRAYYVARSAGEVIGYAGLMLAVGEGHVTTIGVGPQWQHRGIGRLLLLTLATTARQRGAEGLTLEVRVSNTAAQRLYHEFGFAPAGIRKNYYPEVNEDAIVMWAHDVQGAEFGERLERIARRVVEDAARAARPEHLEPPGPSENPGTAG
jgi:ribosomal-protein-alanine N-acetyltransferase